MAEDEEEALREAKEQERIDDYERQRGAGRKRLGGLGAKGTHLTLDPFSQRVREDFETMSAKKGKFSELIRRMLRERFDQIAEEEGFNERSYQQFGVILSLLRAKPTLTSDEVRECAEIIQSSQAELVHSLRELRRVEFVSGSAEKGWNLTKKGERFLKENLP